MVADQAVPPTALIVMHRVHLLARRKDRSLDAAVYDEMTIVLTKVLSEHGAPDAVAAEIGELLVRDRTGVLNAARPTGRTVHPYLRPRPRRAELDAYLDVYCGALLSHHP
jgi:hypothetical protein